MLKRLLAGACVLCVGAFGSEVLGDSRDVARVVQAFNARATPPAETPNSLSEDGTPESKPPLVAWTVTNPGPVQRGCALEVAVLGATSVDSVQNVLNSLAEDPRIATVTAIVTTSVTPTAAELGAFDSVLVFTNSAPLSSVGLGNSLADYVDAGGGVVLTMFALRASIANRTIEGRFLTDNYYCIQRTVGSSTTGQATLGTIHIPSSPILDGVATFDGGSSSFRTPGTLHPQASRIADWSTGQILIATRNDRVGKRVDLGFYPVSAANQPGGWVLTTDGAQLLRNAVVVTGECDAPACRADFNGDGSVDSQDFFDFIVAFFAGC